MNCGLFATIIKYRTSNDIDVKFENNVIRKNARYDHFIKGMVQPERIIQIDKSRIGMEKEMRNGLKAKIIDYRKANDIDIKFEDGAVVNNVRYAHFKEGGIAHPNIKYNNSVSLQEFAIYYYLRKYGFCKIEKGEWKNRGFGNYELDFYHKEKNIAIEYDGGWHDKPAPKKRDLKKNESCKKLGIVLYRLRDPSLSILKNKNSINYILDKEKNVCLGIIDCKIELEEILSIHNIVFHDNDINFERDKDKIIKEYNSTYLNYYKKKYEGNVAYSHASNKNMTLIEYRSASDIDVEFDDGVVRKHVTYNEFKKGSIRHPNETNLAIAKQRLGETKMMNNKMNATIIAYRTSKDIDIQFEDGKRPNKIFKYVKKKKLCYTQFFL